MSQNAIESFIGRAITDKSFRQLAMVSLEYACASAGLTVSSVETVCLKSLDLSLFDQLAENVDVAIRRN